MKVIKRLALSIDSIFEWFSLTALTSMTLIVIIQVITRKLFNFVFFWSEEVTLLLMVWFSFMGIAIGFREKLHIATDSFTNRFGKRFNQIWDKVIALVVFGFGLYLVINGWQFTIDQYETTLPATGLTNSLYYLVMPITGIMICVYSALSLLGIETIRHRGLGEEFGE
ncbi:TRAP transporter small permease [Paenibacillus sedimenti]|uniref:TRAP transporter small permease n=1 Tax=Paenibacillus sedimenti TaxID=2770274 RepID=A0A926KMU6_9BACL|nr:TRAP transporter small permease [Paenibacillus sedimenti]MBD0379686.1 TRAP transporter small permease [Paenibacillus sedimenti]